MTLKEHFRQYFNDKTFRNPYYKNELAKEYGFDVDSQFLTYDQYIDAQLSKADITTVEECEKKWGEDWDEYIYDYYHDDIA